MRQGKRRCLPSHVDGARALRLASLLADGNFLTPPPRTRPGCAGSDSIPGVDCFIVTTSLAAIASRGERVVSCVGPARRTASAGHSLRPIAS